MASIGCSGDDEPDFYYEALPIESINLPDSFNLNETYTIDFTFTRPTTCHAYDRILIWSDEENRTLAVSSVVLNNTNCEVMTEDNISYQSFEFEVIYNQTYVFNIWKGKDDNNEDIYETYEIPVID